VRAERDRLQHVGAAADAAIHHHRHVARRATEADSTRSGETVESSWRARGSRDHALRAQLARDSAHPSDA
jgi:hypothetical protein